VSSPRSGDDTARAGGHPALTGTAISLRTLAATESRRYARHPLFSIGVVLLAVTTAVTVRELEDLAERGSVGEAAFLPVFFLGLLGVLVGHRLTETIDRAADAVDATPTSATRRTAAVCLACLVPGAVALVWVACIYAALAVYPVPDATPISRVDRAAMLGAAVTCAVGGPLFGVLAARWTRIPGAGLVAALVLVAWVLLGTFALALAPSRWSGLLHLSPPYTQWILRDASGPVELVGGSPPWHLLYTTLLCGLAVTAALSRTAGPARRPGLLRVGLLLLVLALTSLGLAAAPDPARVLL
jgi:hypothetical protein